VVAGSAALPRITEAGYRPNRHGVQNANTSVKFLCSSVSSSTLVELAKQVTPCSLELISHDTVFSLATNQSIVLSAMAYQPNEQGVSN
jgi:hypothetical protein